MIMHYECIMRLTNPRVLQWRSVVVKEEDDALRSTLRKRRSTSGLGEGAGVRQTWWYLQLGWRRLDSSNGERWSEVLRWWRRGRERRRRRSVLGFINEAEPPESNTWDSLPARSSCCSRRHAWKRPEGRRRWVACCLARFVINYRIAIDPIFQITQKFSKELEILQIQNLLNFSNPTTFLIKTFSNSA
jgi:hypothetical protein